MVHANSSTSAAAEGGRGSSRGQSATGRGRGSTTRTKTRHQSSVGRGGQGSGGRGDANSSEADRSHQKSKGRGGTSSSTRNQQHPRQQQTRMDRSLRRIKPFTSDFASMHVECQAARYKVHRPGCNCSKMKTVRERLRTENGDDSEIPADLNGLVVLPDIKSIDSIYFCLDTDDASFSNDPKEAELKLRGELFSEEDQSGGYLEQKNTSSSHPYKVSCAQCLLVAEPNGFVCISSPSTQTVAVAKNLALKRIRYKKVEEIPLHSDHAEHLAVISRKILWQLSNARTRDQTNKANYSLVGSLNRQGIGDIEDQQIELGHHLASLLHITKKDTDADSTLWLVMMQWSGKKWNIDLPGGKRHLGETSFEGATRECEEECSLTIDATWVHGEPRRSMRKADESNLYYILRPPSDVMMESLESNPFWHETGFCKEPALKD